MIRSVEREWLDELPADVPAAIASRGDLQRVNWWMGHAGILHRALRKTSPSPPLRVVELGAGDGTFLLSLAARWPARGARIAAVLVDRQNVVRAKTLEAFQALGWDVQVVQADVFDWLAQPALPSDWLLANLFLHHFHTERLRELLSFAAESTNVFVACEPRRAALPLAATRLLGLIGCNAITRHDARVSVQAGFAGHELSALWPSENRWQLREQAGGLFSHCFVARRKETPGNSPTDWERLRRFPSTSGACLNLREISAASCRECSRVMR